MEVFFSLAQYTLYIHALSDEGLKVPQLNQLILVSQQVGPNDLNAEP